MLLLLLQALWARTATAGVCLLRLGGVWCGQTCLHRHIGLQHYLSSSSSNRSSEVCRLASTAVAQLSPAAIWLLLLLPLGQELPLRLAAVELLLNPSLASP
jgi:hypothetical protein